jgi:hypothetical protein
MKETGSHNVKLGFNKVKLPEVGSNAIVPVPVGALPNKHSRSQWINSVDY